MFYAKGEILSIILEGKPGSGKTTLMKHCAITWAKDKAPQTTEKLIQDKDEQLPLFEKDLVVFIQRKHEGENFDETVINAVPKKEREMAKELLEEHPEKCFLFVDAIDEFRNEKVIREAFESAEEGSTNIIISCRDGHPYLDNQMGNFIRHVKVAGFEPDDAQNFIRALMRSIMRNDVTACDEKSERICEHIKKDKLNKLYTSPINCAFICLLYSRDEISDTELSTMTMQKLFTKHQNFLLQRECYKQFGSSDIGVAEPTLRSIYQLAICSLILHDEQSWYTSKQLTDIGIDVKSPAMVLLTKEKKSDLDGEEDLFSWPHETIKEFHAAMSLKGNQNVDILYVIASKPELNVVTDFIISMMDETDLELAKTLLAARLLLQSKEPQCISSTVREQFEHCCSQISRLKQDIQTMNMTALFQLEGAKILRSALDVTEIQQCIGNTDWMVKNWREYASLTISIKESSSDNLQIQLHRSVLHPFLPSFASGDSARDFISQGATEKDPIDWSQCVNIKDETAFVYPCSDNTYHSMVGWFFTRICKNNPSKRRKIDNECICLEGVCLFLFVDSTLRCDDYTAGSFQGLAHKVKEIDFLVLDINEDCKKLLWSKGSIKFIRNILKPRKGVILRNELAKRFTDFDLEELAQCGVQKAHVGYFGETIASS